MRLGFVLLLAGTASWVRGESATAAGVRLYESQRYAEACVALAPVVAQEPGNAEACHTLGLALSHRGDPGANAAAAPWLQKASELVPANPDYLADYAGNCLQLARVHRSYSLAKQGRDLMEKAIVLDPENLDGRYGLMRFNAEAPWPLGETSKAFAQAGEIARRDSIRGRQAFLWLGRYFGRKGKTETARRAYREVLLLDPHNAAATAALAQLK
jgi:cytochrome c-type biogenesis protein CcmH/NrfG